ncbi:Ubiquitin carrier protein [Zea mays]|jgi:hypothetical protein|uniref:Ubiquitin carrier protein n=1 Tax=Zea mays TaxID=4577 RepID=A0A1D6G553_MAIZE|nr:Ubiquitin carrier protein [Zea mays]AQK98416.1 Ubiquitin carrier protein [Zea mays]
MVDVSRVQKELTECNRDREVSGVSIALHDGANISHLTGTIAGPADSPYEGGTFVIDIRLPGEKPAVPSSPLIPPLQRLPSNPLSVLCLPYPATLPRARGIPFHSSGRFVADCCVARFVFSEWGLGRIRVCCL